MDNERYCTICGRKIAEHIQSQTIQSKQGTMTFHFYYGNPGQSYCFGHQETQPTGRLSDLQRMCKRETTRGTPVPADALSKYMKPVEVPQVFLDAFRDEDLEL